MKHVTEKQLNSDVVKNAVFRAAEILSSMGYHGNYGSVHLLRLNIQTNTLTAILHNLITWQISELDKRWSFYPKGGATPDLTNQDGISLQVKVTSDKYIKGNQITTNEGNYLAIRYLREEFTIKIIWILLGELHSDDWTKPPRTQLAILKSIALAKLKMIFP